MRANRFFKIGPGIIIAAAFIGPGTVTTASIAGASYGYTLLWAMVFSLIATISLQEMAARLGVIGNTGLGEALRLKSKSKLFKIFNFILVISAILIGNAAYEAGNLQGAVLGFSNYPEIIGLHPFIILIAISTFLLLWFGSSQKIEKFMAIMVSSMGLIFLIAMFLLSPDWSAVLKGLFIPKLQQDSYLMVIGLIGTTVVPYNLFLHAASAKKKYKSENELKQARNDTIISILIGGIITMAIIIVAAAAFDGNSTKLTQLNQLNAKLIPSLGEWSANFISFGFLAAGFSSCITAPLAAAYATAEILGFREDFKSLKFRLVWILVLASGILVTAIGFEPTELILMAQVANGILLPILAIYLFWIMNDRSLMRKHTNSLFVNIIGVFVILVSLLLGLRSILSAIGVL